MCARRMCSGVCPSPLMLARQPAPPVASAVGDVDAAVCAVCCAARMVVCDCGGGPAPLVGLGARHGGLCAHAHHHKQYDVARPRAIQPHTHSHSHGAKGCRCATSWEGCAARAAIRRARCGRMARARHAPARPRLCATRGGVVPAMLMRPASGLAGAAVGRRGAKQTSGKSTIR